MGDAADYALDCAEAQMFRELDDIEDELFDRYRPCSWTEEDSAYPWTLEKAQYYKWKQKNGTITPIAEMSNSHVYNTYHYLERRLDNCEVGMRNITRIVRVKSIMKLELERRGFSIDKRPPNGPINSDGIVDLSNV